MNSAIDLTKAFGPILSAFTKYVGEKDEKMKPKLEEYLSEFMEEMKSTTKAMKKVSQKTEKGKVNKKTGKPTKKAMMEELKEAGVDYDRNWKVDEMYEQYEKMKKGEETWKKPKVERSASKSSKGSKGSKGSKSSDGTKSRGPTKDMMSELDDANVEYNKKMKVNEIRVLYEKMKNGEFDDMEMDDLGYERFEYDEEEYWKKENVLYMKTEENDEVSYDPMYELNEKGEWEECAQVSESEE